MVDFNPSPRTTKRRRVSSREPLSTKTSPAKSASKSLLRSLSGAVSGLSRSLFESQDSQGHKSNIFGDSTYGSKESSLNDEAANGDGDAQDAKSFTTPLLQNTAQAGVESEDELNDAVTVTPVKPGTTGRKRITSAVKQFRRSPRSLKSHDTVFQMSLVKESSLRNGTAAQRSMTEIPRNGGRRKTTRSATKASGPLFEGARIVAEVEDMTDLAPGTKVPTSDNRESFAGFRQHPAQSHAIIDTEDSMDTTEIGSRSTGRQRRRPRRYSDDHMDTKPEKTQYISVPSTPMSKMTTATLEQMASDAMDLQEIEEQLGFKDISNSALSPKKSNRKLKKNRTTEPATTPRPRSKPSAKKVPELSREPDIIDEDDILIDDEALPEIPTIPESELETIANITAGLDAEDSSFIGIKSQVLSRLTSRSRVPLSNQTEEFNKVYSLLSATITAGEGNSMLVLGSRGSGKTNLIETAIADLNHNHADEFHVVRLSGFRQTDDRVALREIWRQLGREMEVDEDETNQVSSYADAMASLLHLLSHPEETTESTNPDLVANTTTKAVLFVLDEFDLFTMHPRQTLLYNLFDIAQSRKAPIAVIGCCTRVDIAESLEKRVKSRFSHRWVHLPQPKSLPAFQEVARTALCIEESDNSALVDFNTSAITLWNSYITEIFLPSPPIQSLLSHTFYTTKSIPAVFSALYLPIAQVSLTSSSPPDPAPLTSPDSILTLLPSLPTLHTALLIAAARLDGIHLAPAVNFNATYAHYAELVSRFRLAASASGALAQGGLVKVWGRAVARRAWEELAGWELLVPAPGGGRQEHEQVETRLWRVDVSLEEIGAVVAEGMLGRWCREV